MKDSFYTVYYAPVLGLAYQARIFVARQLTRDLFAAANLRVLFLIEIFIFIRQIAGLLQHVT